MHSKSILGKIYENILIEIVLKNSVKKENQKKNIYNYKIILLGIFERTLAELVTESLARMSLPR